MSARRSKILVLDDSHVVLEMIRRVLGAHGFDVITMSSGVGFSRALVVEQPDLALVDVCMPTLDGARVAAIASRLRDSICPIVLYSSQSPATLDKLARRCGAAGYIEKSPDWDDTVGRIRHFLDATRAPRAAGNGSRA